MVGPAGNAIRNQRNSRLRDWQMVTPWRGIRKRGTAGKLMQAQREGMAGYQLENLLCP